jgi:O-antigen/teichoic acid export membrane protein
MTSGPTPISKESDAVNGASVAASEGGAGVRAAAIGEKVGGGMTWMAISAVLTRGITFAAQILLGRLLDPKDFAIYGTATSVAGFLMVCRDMATGYIIVQRGRENYEQNAGIAFWLGFTYDMVVLAVTIAVAPWLGERNHSDKLPAMLMVMALSLPLGAVANVLYARLRLDLQFKAFSWITTFSAMARQIAMIAFAYAGFQHMSFAWPAVLCLVVDCVGLWWVTRDAVWLRSPRLSQWGGWMKDAIWLMFTSLANFAMDYGPYLVLAPILGGENPTLGYYFFAYQITGQIGVILSFNSTVVLTPALQKLNAEPERQRAAALRALRTLMLAGSVASMGLASIMAPVEHLLWHGKYAESVQAILVLGVFYPWRITFGLSSSLLTAKGWFKSLTYVSAVESAGLMVAALLAGHYSPTVTGIAWWTGAWVLISRFGATIFMFKMMGESARNVIKAMFPSWAVCLIALITSTGIARIPGMSDLILPTAAEQGTGWSSWLIARGSDILAIGILGTACAAVMILLTRVLLHADLRDALRVAPSRMRLPIQRLLRLGDNQPHADPI